ncbi:MAG TPA: T9SS type A sorting domain-containing protein, partial [Draconibacterium sp.]|nr:T9SS type A sorting domain-containing protein [Draconibacterium sp.]
GQEIENCKIIFNNEIKYSDNNGEALFQATANQYSLEAEKRHHRKVAIENLSIYSDTIFNVFLDSAEVFYKVNFELEDKETGEKSSSVNIEIDSKSLKTDLGGTADFTLNPGSFQTYFTKLNYADFQQEFIINSDTTFIVKMNRSHADFKFSVRNGNQPINNALVIFAGDSLYTGSLGICTFRSYPVDSLFNYMIEKEFYFSTVGSITTKTDSVIEIQLQKSAVNIGFVLSGDKEKVDNPIIVIKNDTAVFNQEGTVKLYNVKLNQVIEYEIFSDNYPDYSASLFPEKDTLLYIQLLYTGIENEVKNKKLNIYPNPATEYLIIESDLEFDYIEIANINGMTIKEIRHQSLNCKVDISDLEAGYYIIRFVTTRDIKSRSFIKQER